MYFTCECYHFETRYRTVTYYETVDGKSVQRTRTESYQEKVVTYSGSEDFRYKSSEDVSYQISDDIYCNDFIKIKFSHNYLFANEETRN